LRGAALAYGFATLKLDLIFAITLPDNLASLAVMKRLGLTYRRRVDYKTFTDIVWYDIDREAWQAALAAGRLGQVDLEGRPLLAGQQRQRAAGFAHDAEGQRQAKAGALSGRLGREETARRCARECRAGRRVRCRPR
jgi:hypothetical protein